MKLFHRPSRRDQLAHITQEMYRQNLELVDSNKTLLLLRSIDEIVLNPAVDKQATAQAITTELVKPQQDFSLALIYTLDRQSTVATVQGIAMAGAGLQAMVEIFQTRLRSINTNPSARNAFSHVADKMQIHIATSFTSFSPYITAADDEHLRVSMNVNSLLICPLLANNRLNGIMVLGLPGVKESITEHQKNLAERLTSTVSIAMENRLLYLELQAASIRLREQNAKLKALDESKDEFISLASHQLRTPLTSIKGYLSMVLEGDVGEIKEPEHAMLQKAFDSAQKMVYLISDLLNISRIQSGRFIIDNKPVDLAAIIDNELSQLAQTAVQRNLKLTFNKPNKFPTLMLDDNKIRQVIMNFVDNAIFYTPPGGQVTVDLKTTSKDVVFTVSDTGVGVPAHLQHHLFSKFYRAENARKMRPDGTGIGLFMVKKVIVAQGGALIFKSQEGKGSTFGFSFPLQMVLAPDTSTSVTGVDAKSPVTLKSPTP